MENKNRRLLLLKLNGKAEEYKRGVKNSINLDEGIR